MLSFYGSFKVPGVDYVTIYRDDELAHKFYMVPERPTIARDDEGDPLFAFLLYGRDVERLQPDDVEVQQAYLSLSTQVAVPSADEQKIRDHLRQMLRGEQQRGFRFLRLALSEIEPELGYPPEYVEGSVEFKTFSQEMVKHAAGTKPTLSGTNVASFSQMFSQDGAELFRQAILKGLVPALIHYNLTFLARIPALTIRIRGDRAAFYQELKEHLTQTRVETIEFGWWRVRNVQTWQTTTLKEFQNTFHSLTIEVDDRDFRASADDEEATKKVEAMAFKILEAHILPSFFEQMIPAKKDDQKTDQWLSTQKNVTGAIDVRISKSDVVKVPVNPNAQLAQVLTKDEIEKHTVYVDLSQPFFQELDVKINANVNFASDPIFALNVFIDYDQMDDARGVRVKKAREFQFRNDQVRRFRQLMAKSQDGAPKDTYRYWSELVYKDTGETVRVPQNGALESRERELVISYRRLGFVKVALAMAAMPENIRAVQVQMRCPAAAGPSGQQAFELTRQKPTATFFTYTGGSDGVSPYFYKLTYVLTDGQRVDEEETEGRAETLVIPDPFDLTVTTRFLAQADFSVIQKVIVDAHYRDTDNDFGADHHAELVTLGESSAWAIGLRDPDRRDFEYTQTILYKNGSLETLSTRKGRLGETFPVGGRGVDALEVQIIPMADWTKYKLVAVSLQYEDVANDLRADKTYTFRKDRSADETWKVLLRDRTHRAYRYRIRYVGVNTADSRETDWSTSTDSVLVVE